MNLLFIYFIALGLAAKTFSVTAYNRSIGPVGLGAILKLSVIFAVIQSAMFAIGWFLGLTLSIWLENYSNFLALSLIIIVGIKIIIGTFKIQGRLRIINISSWPELLTLALAIAIDVFLVATGFGMNGMEITKAVLIFSAMIFLMGIAGAAFGKRFKMKYTNLVELAGGLLLTFVGVRGLIMIVV